MLYVPRFLIYLPRRMLDRPLQRWRMQGAVVSPLAGEAFQDLGPERGTLLAHAERKPRATVCARAAALPTA